MRKSSILRLFLLLCLAMAMCAQAPTPKPDAELKKLAALLSGRWTYEGEYKAGPLGPGGKMTGEYTGRTILNGFFFEGRETEKGAMGDVQNIEIDAYDPANKNFISNIYGDDGSRFSGTVTINGNTVTWEGKYFAGGQEILLKEPLVLAADRMSATAKTQISMDNGKTWTPFSDVTFTRGSPASGIHEHKE